MKPKDYFNWLLNHMIHNISEGRYNRTMYAIIGNSYDQYVRLQISCENSYHH